MQEIYGRSPEELVIDTAADSEKFANEHLKGKYKEEALRYIGEYLDSYLNNTDATLRETRLAYRLMKLYDEQNRAEEKAQLRYEYYVSCKRKHGLL